MAIALTDGRQELKEKKKIKNFLYNLPSSDDNIIERHCNRLEYLCGIYAPKSIVDGAKHILDGLAAEYTVLHGINEERLMDCLRFIVDA